MTGTHPIIVRIDALLGALSKIGDYPSSATKLQKQNSDKIRKFRILDGGLGTYLQFTGVPRDADIWSLSALIDEKYHSIVISAHKDYLNAGADIITTNTYSCVPLYIDKCEHSDRWPFEGKPDGAAMIRLAVDLANTARTEFMNETGIDDDSPSKPLIAASIPPLMESYNPNTVLSESQSINHYNQIIRTFKSTEIDLFLIETMSTFNEAKCVLNTMICNGFITKDGDDGRDICLFFALREDGKLRDGLDFNEMMLKLEEYLDVLPIVMVGANCCKPETFKLMMDGMNEKTMEILKEKGVSTGCYPNGMGDIPDNFVLSINNHRSSLDSPKMKLRKDLNAEVLYTAHFKKWILQYCNEKHRLGLIGGCCHVLVDAIEYAAKMVKIDFPELNQ